MQHPESALSVIVPETPVPLMRVLLKWAVSVTGTDLSRALTSPLTLNHLRLFAGKRVKERLRGLLCLRAQCREKEKLVSSLLSLLLRVFRHFGYVQNQIQKHQLSVPFTVTTHTQCPAGNAVHWLVPGPQQESSAGLERVTSMECTNSAGRPASNILLYQLGGSWNRWSKASLGGFQQHFRHCRYVNHQWLLAVGTSPPLSSLGNILFPV